MSEPTSAPTTSAATGAPASTGRPRTPIDEIAEWYFTQMSTLSPMLLTDLGSSLRQDEYDDLSPAGLQQQLDLMREALRRLDAETARDAVDEVTLAAMRERLGLELEMADAGLHLLSLNGIASGLHAIRAVYDQMPQASVDDWRTIIGRLHAVPAAADGWLASQRAAIARGVLPATRQVDLLVEQVRSWTSEGDFFDSYVRDAAIDGQPLPGELAADLRVAAEVARASMVQAADVLEGEIRDASTATDGVGRERYQLYSRAFLGSSIDIDETYQWGLDEVARIERLQRETAERIVPGASVAEAMAHLDADPAYLLHRTDALKLWMQGKADEAITNLAGTHFDVPEQVRRIECCIAPTHDGGIYYTGPSEDFSRPGRMWWSVPEGVETFTTWRELTTVYHEGVPGHHLQVGQTAARSNLLNTWRRFGTWVSGHGEGWALYSEWLMAELGYLDDPGDMMGMLDSQSLRAARVVIDLGVHCGLPAPDEVGGGEWTYDKAWDYFNRHVSMEPGTARFEVNRYFGWPGQAPSYKLGQRMWLDLRAEVQQALGDDFDLKTFHRTALDIGSVGLDVLRDAVLKALVPSKDAA